MKRFGKTSYLAAAAFVCAMQAAAMGQAAAAPAAQTQPAAQDADSPTDTASADAIENRKELKQAWEDASQNPSALNGKFNRVGIAGSIDRAAFMRNRAALMKIQATMMAGRQLILSRPGDSLQVLIDMFYPLQGHPVDDSVVEPLVKALRDDSWRVREDATRKLKAMGTAAWPRLLAYVHDADLEVRCRVEFLLGKGNNEQRQRLERFATLMATSMRLEDLLPVARRNFLRLLDNDDSAQPLNSRIRQPLLASLRYSSNAHDRDLLALAKGVTNPDRRTTLDSTIQQRAVAQPMMPINPSPFWNDPPPKHDYEGALDRLLDDTNGPAIFAKAVSCAEHDGRFIDHMKALRQKTSNKAIARQIDKLLGEAVKKK